ncbi:hypothetical protein [Streptomyces oceani]|uniref:hypothetical protein n=1 Tax=Streptomyces oceani TaxID=1075402 RepID=UPI0008731E11|nr:hypothetical protein [Streptomyces oceani]
MLLRRLLLVGASGGVGFLLLSALGYALEHPEATGDARIRLLWCLVPLAATVHLAAAVARTETGARAMSGLDAAGIGPARLPALAAVSATLSSLLGSALGLLVFLLLRGDVHGVPYSGVASELLGGQRPMPTAAALTLLCVTPLSAACVSALTVRTAPTRRGVPAPARTEPTGPEAASPRAVPDTAAQPVRQTRAAGAVRSAYPGTAGAPEHGPGPAPSEPAGARRQSVTAPAGLPWGTALVATGVALVAFTHSGPSSALRGDELLPLPGTLDGSPPGVLLGWLLTACGLVLAGPGLTYLCGRLIGLGRPGVLRLLAGRTLQEEARRIGPPVGAMCAVASGGLAALELYGDLPAGEPRVFGPLTALGAGLVLCCVAASLLTATGECRTARTAATDTLRHIGAPRSLLRRAAAVRGVSLVALLVPVIWAVGTLAALPLRSTVG